MLEVHPKRRIADLPTSVKNSTGSARCVEAVFARRRAAVFIIETGTPSQLFHLVLRQVDRDGVVGGGQIATNDASRIRGITQHADAGYGHRHQDFVESKALP